MSWTGLIGPSAAAKPWAVLGRSGSGKSVLLKLIVGLQQPDSGSIRIHGQELPSSDVEALNEIRKSMGFLFQHAALYDSLTVAENVAFPLRRHRSMTPSERSDRVAQLLRAVGMEKDLQKFPSNISGGIAKARGPCARSGPPPRHFAARRADRRP
jgi:phospholipid/cholesterol/gamma-HCH transport system ATP-binding protein